MFKGVFLLLLTVFAWGVMYPASKSAVDSGIDGYYLTAIRYGLGSLFVAMLLMLFEGRKAFNFEGHFKKLWCIGTVGFAGLNFFTFVGIGFSSAEHATVIFALLPIISILINWVAGGGRPAFSTLCCVFFAFVGIVIVITKLDLKSLGGGSVFGDVLLLIATFSWGLYTYYITKFTEWTPLRATSLSSIPGTLSILVITALLTYYGVASLPPIDVVKANYAEIFILVVTTAAIITWNGGVKILGVVNGVLFVNLVPVVTFAIGFIKGNEITLAEVVGASITISALVMNNVMSRRKAKNAQEPERELQALKG